VRRAGSIAAAALAALLAVLSAPAAAPAQVPPAPSVSAPSAIVIETHTGDVAFRRGADQRRAIASTTKLMTALLALEQGDLGRTYRAGRYRALPVESKINLRTGERMTVADLLRGLLLASANDAAVTLAERIGGSRSAFVRRMNERARELGLGNTRFANPIGLDAPGNFSTARDLARLTIRLRRFDFFRKTVNQPSVMLQSGDRPRTIANRNLLVRRVPFVSGVKTGHTAAAGWVLVGSASRRGVTVVSVVLGTPSEAARNADSLSLLRYGLARYRRARAVRRGQVLARPSIRFRPGATLEVVAARNARRVIRRGERFRLHVRDVPTEVEGPIRAGQRLGSVDVRLHGRRVATVALVADSDVAEAGIGDRTKDWFTRPGTLLLVVAAVAGTVGLVLLRRRSDGRAARRREAEPA
jgi:D-alanyl-D-alanine carboxypeptidase (penicillin-binding protein 5/6)